MIADGGAPGTKCEVRGGGPVCTHIHEAKRIVGLS